MSNGITPGEWVVRKKNPTMVAAAEFLSGDESSLSIGSAANYPNSGLFPNINEAIANAKLFAEAGTVANETGLTPRQLAEQRAELLIALKGYMGAVDTMNAAMKDGVNVHGAISALIGCEEMAHQAIANATGEGNG